MVVRVQDVARRVLARDRLRRDKARRRADGLLVHNEAAARLLRAAGARRVWLFGSLAEGRARLESDVDLAVEGLPASTAYFRLVGDLVELYGTNVDLVELEKAPPGLAARILELGIPL